jgi:transcription elongation factor GreA
VTHDPAAAGLLRSVGLLPDGPVVWGRPIPATGPGVFLVELPAPRPHAPIELTRVGKWLERVETLRLDGERPTSKQLAARIGAFWLPSQPVLHIGGSGSSVAGRVKAIRTTVLGDRRPNPSGHWLHLLTTLETARVWWAVTDAVEEYEDALLAAFAAGVAADERAALPDPETVLPFATQRTPTGSRKRTGVTGSILPEPAAPPPPGRRIVQLPDGDAEGARGEPPASRSSRRASAAPRRTPARGVAAPTERPTPPPTQLTRDGEERLRGELRELVEVRRPDVIARIRAAKELGDLKENADYTAAREEQGFVEGRVQALEAILRTAVVVDGPGDGMRIGLGSRVTVETGGDEVTYELVSTAEVDPANGRISVESPVGKALIGRAAGDEVVIRTPRGDARYRIIDTA